MAGRSGVAQARYVFAEAGEGVEQRGPQGRGPIGFARDLGVAQALERAQLYAAEAAARAAADAANRAKGATVHVAKSRIKSRRKLDKSMMLSATQLGLNAQEVADIVAYLRTGK